MTRLREERIEPEIILSFKTSKIKQYLQVYTVSKNNHSSGSIITLNNNNSSYMHDDDNNNSTFVTHNIVKSCDCAYDDSRSSE